MHSKTTPSPLVTLFWVGACFGCAVLLCWAFLVAYPALPYFQPPEGSGEAPPAGLMEAVAPEEVGAVQADLLSGGSRLVGQPGAVRAARRVEDAFRAAGIRTIVHESKSAVPVTAKAEFHVEHEDGSERIRTIALYPFMPNHMQPPTTAGNGVSGELVLLDTETLRTRTDFSNVIGLIDASPGRYDPDFAVQWTRYARLGIKALVISSPQGLEAVDWNTVADQYAGILSSAPVNFPRVATSPEVFDYVGREVRIDLKVHWRKRPNPMVIGVIEGRESAREAIVVLVRYDAASILPDRAFGAMEAFETSYLIQLAKGLAPLQGTLERDVVLVAIGGLFNGMEGQEHLLRLLRLNYGNQPAKRNTDPTFVESISYREQPVMERLRTNEAEHSRVRSILPLFGDPLFLSDADATEAKLGTLSEPVRGFLQEQSKFVLKNLIMSASEEVLDAKVEFERMETVDPASATFKTYQSIREYYVEINNLAGLNLSSVLRRKSAVLEDIGYRAMMQARFAELDSFHTFEDARFRKELEIVNVFDAYRQFIVLQPFFGATAQPDAPTVMQLSPITVAREFNEKEKHGIFSNIVSRRADQGANVSMAPLEEKVWSEVTSYFGHKSVSTTYFPSWTYKGYTTYVITNMERAEAFRTRHHPVLRDWMQNAESLRDTLSLSTEFIYTMADGAGVLGSEELQEYRIRSFGGRVLASGIGNSIVPNHPLAGALVSNRPRELSGVFNTPGYFEHLFLITDPYGRYDLFEASADFPVWWRVHTSGSTHNPIAAAFDEDGLIRYIKDEGAEGQRQFKSVNVSIDNRRAIGDVTIVCFRAAPTTILDLNNPQSMRDYAAVRMVTAEGLTDFRKSIQFRAIGLQQFYLEPDRRFFALLQAGVEGNENVRATRAFLTNVENTPASRLTTPTSGRGYLVADTPVLDRVPFRTSDAMLFTNGERLDLQNEHRMADERVNLYHMRAHNLREQAETPDLPLQEADRMVRESVVYSSLNHPVLRESISEAVWGILWYLFLMVPFIFFFEKLIFCYADTRKQVVAQIGIFLVCFVLLRLLHPAFEMVRSSLMILLGFVIILISGGITFLFSSKFKENLEELRKKAGKVTAAEINKAGVLGSAFMLGLNNMHRRKVRTGLTCGTLVLLTFVMISFTSVQSDLVDESLPLGKAPYQGLLIRKENFRHMSPAEVFAYQQKFGDDYQVARRNALIGLPNRQQAEQKTPEIQVVSDVDGRIRETIIHSFLKFDSTEPLQGQIEFVSARTWFTEEDASATQLPVMISGVTAATLGITPEAVDAGEAYVSISGQVCRVKAIFVADSLEILRDLNGDTLLPFDLGRATEFVEAESAGGREVRIDESEPRVPARDVILTPHRALPVGGSSVADITLSVAVGMPEAGFREASEVIESYLVQTGEPGFYGLDGVAYRGLQTRQASMAGLVDLIIPLLIAGLTVLNTMKGSVYERRDEIFVYNAVGIAPRYVFFMFIAESFVYAVVGSVLGYILSQGVGRVLTELDLTGGLNMTYTSMTTIYASWTIMAAVFISTWFPARQAMEISAPSEDSGWDVPEPDGDKLAFDLPFNFRHRGRFAIVAFFNRFLSEHGEGGAGRFFAGVPEIGLMEDPKRPGQRIPFIEARIWLKPFDLGVSQSLRIEMPVDEETGLYKARLNLERISGTLESWTRLNKPLIAQLRRQFLHWRAVAEVDREELFEESRELFKASLEQINARQLGTKTAEAVNP